MQFLKKNPSDEQFSIEIVPAIIEPTFAELARKISLVEGMVSTISIDVMDGIFVPAYSWPYSSPAAGGELMDIDDLSKLGTKLAIELHMMIVNPEEVLHEWLTHGEVKRVLLHPESTTHLDRALAIVHEKKREAGLSLRMETPLEDIAPYIDRVSYVQLMGIKEIGFGGKPFDEEVLSRITKLRAMHPHVTIAVDGGISRITAPKVIKAGADVLVAGSALFRSTDIAAEVEALKGRG